MNTCKYTRITVCWDGALDIHMTSHHIDATAYHFHSLCSEIKPFLELVFFCLSFFLTQINTLWLTIKHVGFGYRKWLRKCNKKHALGHQNKSLKHEKQKGGGGGEKTNFLRIADICKGISHSINNLLHLQIRLFLRCCTSHHHTQPHINLKTWGFFCSCVEPNPKP